MEPERDEDQHRHESEDRKRDGASPGHGEFHPPFASEGLEQVRDSHC